MSPPRGPALLVAALTVAVFAGALAAPLAFDDKLIVRHHPVVNGSLGPLQAFGHGWWEGVAGARGNEYRPLSTLALALEVRALGARGVGLRAVGLALHLATALLLFALARRLGLDGRAAGLAAILFALHPAHVEVVGSVVGQAEGLQTLLVLGALLAFVSPGRAAGLLWPLATVAAVLAKESAIVAPVLMAGTAAWLHAARRAGRDAPAPPRPAWWPMLAYLALPLYAWARGAVLGAFTGTRAVGFVENPLVDAGAAERLWASAALLGEYARLLLLPVRLSADYSYDSLPLPGGPIDPRFVVPALLGAAAVAGALRARGSIGALALGWFGVSLAVASNLLFPIGTIFGERLAHLASVGASLAGGAALAAVLSRAGSRARVLVLLVPALFAVRVVERCADLRSEERLFAAVVRAYPRNVKARYNLAAALDARGDLEGVSRELDAALEVMPSYAEARVARAALRLHVGRPDAAAEDLARAVESDPTRADAWWMWGRIAADRGDCAAARPRLERALELEPALAGAASASSCLPAELAGPSRPR